MEIYGNSSPGTLEIPRPNTISTRDVERQRRRRTESLFQ
jgi:hypothetical protein